MAWIGVALVLLLAAGWASWKLRSGLTIYFLHGNGFNAFHFGKPQETLRPVCAERYERILQRFVQGDLFDSIWIAHHPVEGDGGLTLTLADDEVEMAVSFLSLKEPQRLATFRERLHAWNYGPVEENAWNVGLGEDNESVTLTCRFKRELDLVGQVAERALDALEGPKGNEVFVMAWSTPDFPRGMGIKVIPTYDPLTEVP